MQIDAYAEPIKEAISGEISILTSPSIPFSVNFILWGFVPHIIFLLIVVEDGINFSGHILTPGFIMQLLSIKLSRPITVDS